MAATDQKAPRNGWQHQAEHLAVKHTATMARAATAVADHVRHRPTLPPAPRLLPIPIADAEPQLIAEPRKPAPVREVEPSPTHGERDKERAQKAVPPRIMNVRRETLAARAVLADGAIKRLAELEVQLDASQEHVMRRDNENHSLQASLNLLVSDNLHLSRRLAESSALVEDLRFQFEKTKRALVVAEVERDKLASTAAKGTETQSRQRAHLDFTSASLVALEKRLIGAQQDLLACNAENGSLAHRLAEASNARKAAELKLERFRNALEAKERQLQELERFRNALAAKDRQVQELARSRAQLIEDMNLRDLALSQAQEKIKSLAELVAQIELNAKCGANTEAKIGERNPRRQDERPAHPSAEAARSKVRMNTILQRELDNDQWLLVGRGSGRLS